MNKISRFFTYSFLIYGALALFCYSIDPYDKYGFNFFNLKTKSVAMARENKFNMIEYGSKKYEAFLLGSSAAHRFHTSDIKQLTGFETFNYSVQHSTPEDYLAITRHIVARQSPKMILLQIDFDSMNKYVETDNRFYSSPLKKYLTQTTFDDSAPAVSMLDRDYVTLKAVSDSVKVLWVNYFGKARHLYQENGDYQDEKDLNGKLRVPNISYAKYKICPKRIMYLKEIQRICHEKNIKLVVWTTPFPESVIKKIMNNKDDVVAYTAYRTSLKQIFDQVNDLTDLTSEIHNDLLYFQDITHPSRRMTQIALKRVFPSHH